MDFKPEKYKIKDEALQPYIDVSEIEEILNTTVTTTENLERIIQKSLNKNRLSLQDVAVLVNATEAAHINKIKKAARIIKEEVYGNRIVLFAPLYVGSYCASNCSYCGFRASNKESKRTTLSRSELIKSVEALEENGQKRLILVYGEHEKKYDAAFIAETVRTVYQVKKGKGSIRRVNINAAPMDIEGFKMIKEAEIGTYQIFQETYHSEAYKKYHLSGQKSNYNERLIALDKAMEAGIDDVGIGALFGLYDWRFEILGLLRHVNHLEACYNVGPHTISFPRLQKASGVEFDEEYLVKDADFVKIVAILRLAVPYTGMILTAREPIKIRKEVLQYGCSQVDAGTKIEMGAYAKEENKNQDLDNEQFLIQDDRSLGDVIDELLDDDYMPSFCTACYRLGRTGEHFMEFSVPGFIKDFCSPNAMLTLAEYIMDYAKPETAEKGWRVIEHDIKKLDPKIIKKVQKRISQIKEGKRDLYF